MLAGCWPTEAQKARGAEEQRIQFLNRQCEGDIAPKRDSIKEAIIKINGQWYVGPNEYYSNGIHGAQFYWWQGKPISRKMSIPKEMQSFFVDGKSDQISVTIFLTGRQRWPNPTSKKPWDKSGWEGRFDQLKTQGLQIERTQLRPDLERVRFFDSTGTFYRHEYYLANQQSKPLGPGKPGVACDLHTDAKLQTEAGCTGGFYWDEDIYVDFRVHARHAQDWPTIHQEIIRVVNLLKKVTP